MTKRLMILVGILAVSLMAAVPAFAQPGISGPSEEVIVTGVLRELDVDCNECAHYAITDEATGTDYKLVSDPRSPQGGVDLGQYVGLMVTAHGIPQFNSDGLFVTQIQSADGQSPQTVTATFELTVKGEVPVGTEFFGIIGSPEIATGLLMDQDGDGVYIASLPVERGTEQEVRIERTDLLDSGLGVTTTIKDFGAVTFDEDKTFRARVNFKRDRGDDDTETPEETTPTTPDPDSGGSDDGGSNGGGSGGGPDLTAPENGVDLNEDGSTDGADGETAAATSDAAMEAHQASGGHALPATGGASALPIAGVTGALLVGGGLLIRRLSR